MDVNAMNAKEVATSASMVIQNQSWLESTKSSELTSPVKNNRMKMAALAVRSSTSEMLLASCVLMRTPLNVAKSDAKNAEMMPSIIPS